MPSQTIAAPVSSAFVDVPTALEEIRAGRMLVVVDDEDRENEGDLTLAAEFVTPEAINFMARFGRGLICLTLTEDRADHLQGRRGRPKRTTAKKQQQGRRRQGRTPGPASQTSRQSSRRNSSDAPDGQDGYSSLSMTAANMN